MANLQHAEDDSKHVKTSAQVTAVAGQKEPAADGTSSVAAAAVVASCSIPSFAAASELLSAPYSCLVMNTHRRHISLPPVFLNKKRTGIQEELQAELLKFSESLKGVPLAYDKVRIVGHHGDIYDDSGYVHMDIMANFIVFQPKKGQKLLGRVNKLAASHVGCLVHGCFNASIPKPHLVPLETWRDAGPQIGAELEFQVTALDSDNVGVLLIRGQLDRTRVQELLALSENPATAVSVDQAAATETEPDPVSGSESAVEAPVDTPKKKKKKKKTKDKIKEEMPEPDGQVAATITAAELDKTTADANGDDANGDANGNDANGDDAGGERKKKRKKKKVKEEEEEMQVSAAERHGSESSGYHSDKASKKRRRDPSADGLSEELQKSTKKKKRTSGTEQLA